eukprot:Gb_14654 [translate_table: standard]
MPGRDMSVCSVGAGSCRLMTDFMALASHPTQEFKEDDLVLLYNDEFHRWLQSLNKMTWGELDRVVKALEKISRDGFQLLKGEALQPTVQQMQLRVGLRPCLNDCLEGLKAISEMHHAE